MKRRVWEILNNPRPGDTVGRILSFGLMLLIATNVVASILATDADIRAAIGRNVFRRFELVSLVIFSIEYLLRVWSCTADPRYAGAVRGRIKWMLTPMAIVDLLAIAPSLLDILLPGTLDLRFLRVLRLMRLFRLMRFGRFGFAFTTLVRVVRAKRVELGVTLGFVLVATVVSAGALFLLEHDQPDTQFSSIPRAMWWSVITITTIGYGDMVPQTSIGQVVGGFVGFVGICTLALPVGILSAGFMEEMARRTAETEAEAETPARECPHCGGALDEPPAPRLETDPLA